jgi:hypothetical protein
MTEPTDLLQAHEPALKYDSQEAYFADSAAEWTDNPGNRLVKTDGTVIASQADGLSLAFLGDDYPDGSPASSTDVVSDPKHNYAEQARALHQNSLYANQMLGHAVRDSHGDLWLQYWFFYFYNDYNLIGNIIKAGLHEGDWEMVQIRLADDGPDLAVYAQHRSAEMRNWRQVDLLPGTERPIVYVARGSHASYFEPGTHWTGVWFDYADAKRRSPELALHVVDASDDAWRWLQWPGHWGDTKAGSSPLDSDSPVGPAAHEQWNDPLVLVAKAEAVEVAPASRAPSPPPPPRVSADWHDGGIRVTYETFPTADGTWPTGIVVTINSFGEAAPPTTEAFPIEASTGFVDVTVPVTATLAYDIYVSSATPDGLASSSVRIDLEPR